MLGLLIFSYSAKAQTSACVIPAPNVGCTPPATFDQSRVVTGDVTWASLGLGSADNVTQTIRITGTGKVRVESINLILKSSNAVIYIDGVELIVENGNLQMDASGSRFLMTNGILRTSGNYQQTTNTITCITSSTVDIGEEIAGVQFAPGNVGTSANFQNDGG